MSKEASEGAWARSVTSISISMADLGGFDFAAEHHRQSRSTAATISSRRAAFGSMAHVPIHPVERCIRYGRERVFRLPKTLAHCRAVVAAKVDVENRCGDL